MADGRFRQYYWEVRTLLAEKDHLLDRSDPEFELSQEIDAEYIGAFWATIVFVNGSRLAVRFMLTDADVIEEFNYSYQYLDAQGKRVFRYDDAPHHPEVATHPHHVHRGPEPPQYERDKAYALDVHRVDFATIFARIEQRCFS